MAVDQFKILRILNYPFCKNIIPKHSTGVAILLLSKYIKRIHTNHMTYTKKNYHAKKPKLIWKNCHISKRAYTCTNVIALLIICSLSNKDKHMWYSKQLLLLPYLLHCLLQLKTKDFAQLNRFPCIVLYQVLNILSLFYL